MNKQMLALMQKRGELLAQIQMQRGQLSEIGQQWQAPLALADQGIAAWRWLRANPLLAACATATIFLVRRRGLGGVVNTGWRAWKLYRMAGSWLATASQFAHGQRPPPA